MNQSLGDWSTLHVPTAVDSVFKTVQPSVQSWSSGPLRKLSLVKRNIGGIKREKEEFLGL